MRTKNKTLTQHDIGEYLVLSHLNMANCDTQAKNLLELELDRGTDLRDLVVEILSMRDGGGELSSCMAVSETAGTTRRSTYPWTDRDQGDEESA